VKAVIAVLDPQDWSLIKSAPEFAVEELFKRFCAPDAKHKEAEPLVIGARFDGKRDLEHCIERNVIPLDIEGRPFDDLTKHLKDLGVRSIVFTSASHLKITKKNPTGEPRLKALVFLSRSLTPAEWPRAANWIRKYFFETASQADMARITFAPMPGPDYRCELVDCPELDVDSLPAANEAVKAQPKKEAGGDRVEKLVQLFSTGMPPTGHRHDFYLGLAGFCAKQELPCSEAKGLTIRLCVKFEALDKIGVRGEHVESTYTKHAKGEIIAGEDKLTKAMSFAVGEEAAAGILQAAARIMACLPDRQEIETREAKPQDRPPPAKPSGKKLEETDLSTLVYDLATTPGWRGILAWDEFSQKRCLLEASPTDMPLEAGDGVWTDNDTVSVKLWFETKRELTASKANLDDAIENVCKRNKINLVVQMLEALPPGDDKAINELSEAFGFEEQIETKMLRKWLLSAVARAYVPGTFIKGALALQGPQNAGKSTALRILFGQYHSSLSSDLSDDKRVAEIIRGKWLAELEEGYALKSTDQKAMKRTLSLQYDDYRGSYERHAQRRQRTCVFAVTTNDDTFLDDATGNVRYYCARVGEHIDLERVKLLKDRVWAEARDAYKAGEDIYLKDEADQIAAEEHAKQFMNPNLLDKPVETYLTGKKEVSLDDVAHHLQLAHDLTVRAEPGSLTKKVSASLTRLGCKMKRKSKVRLWVVPPEIANKVPANPLLSVLK
jgi:Virulence-associated protein E